MTSEVVRTLAAAALLWSAPGFAPRLALALGLALATPETELSNDHPTILVENIRRQLMDENYDYMPSETEEMFPIKHELSNERTTVTSPEDDDKHENNRAISLDSDINDQFIPRTNDIKPHDDFTNDNSHVISKNDLLYYVDDDRLKHKATEETDDNVIDDSTTIVAETTTPKVKYKFLKVKQPHPNRRSQMFRRFIQEEGDEGVAIINLDDEPFPEFRLPRRRRQYMTDHEDFDSALEIAPLSDIEDLSNTERNAFHEFNLTAQPT